VPYGTESLPKTSLADAALHGCSLTRRSNTPYHMGCQMLFFCSVGD
jgi:hypothetical protein